MSEMLQPGDVLDDSYEIIEFISKGGFGAVYRARQLSMDRDVALKLLIPGAQPDFEGLIKRFRNEVKAVRNLRHPNTVQIYDFHESSDGQLYFTMEYLEGRSLRDLLKNGEPISPKRTADILAQSLKSLAEAHSTGIIHRDIKPANIMLVDMYGEDDFVKVLDFGIAKAVEDGNTTEADEPLTRTGFLVGTVRYMAPERIAGDPAGAYSDIYSLGLVGASLLVGRPLLGNSSRLEAMQLQMSPKPLPVPPQIIGTALGPVLERALAKNPKHRYQTAEEMLEDLQRVSDVDLEHTPLDISAEIPISDALGSGSSSGIEPTTIDSEIQSGPVRNASPQSGEQKQARPSAPTGWGQQEAVRAPNSSAQESPGSTSSSGPQARDSRGPDEKTAMFTPDAPSTPGPNTSEVADRSDSQLPAPPQPRPKPKESETASKRLEAPVEASKSSKLPMIAGIAAVLIALGSGLTWLLLQERNNGESVETTSPSAESTAAADALVELTTEPIGATVSEDGARLGVTPLELKPSKGRRLVVDLDGYQTRRIELGPDAPKSYTLELEPAEDDEDDAPESLTFDEEVDRADAPEQATSAAPGGRADVEPSDEPAAREEAAPEPRKPAPRRERPRPKPDEKPEPAPEPSDEDQGVIPVFGGDEPDSAEQDAPKETEEKDEDIPVF